MARSVDGVHVIAGEDNREVLRELLALTKSDIAALDASGVISSRVPAVTPR